MTTHLANCGKANYSWDREITLREGDYAYARTRVPDRKRSMTQERGYRVAIHFADVIASRVRKDQNKSLGDSFRAQVQRWKDETGHLGSIMKAIAHPSYLRIIGMAKDSANSEIERLLLCELESEPDYWFSALTAITGEDPTKPEHDFDEAVNAWLEWGREKGLM